MAAVANKVVQAMATLISATEMASQIAGNAKHLVDTVKEITECSYEALQTLRKEAADIARSEVKDFHSAMEITMASGEDLQRHCLSLHEQWNEFEDHMSCLVKSKKFTKAEIRKSIDILQHMLKRASGCHEKYMKFKECLNYAIQVGTTLAQRCQVAADEARSSASKTRGVGYTATAILGGVAAGFLVIATGGVAAIGAAAFGAAAVGTGAFTASRAHKLEALAQQFDSLKQRLNNSLQELEKLGDTIEGLHVLTENMVKNMETALKLFQQQEQIREENEAKDAKILELEAKIRAMEAGQ